MDNELHNTYKAVQRSFSQLDVEDKREEIANKINEISETINMIDPVSDFDIEEDNYVDEDKYLNYLNQIIYNLENKLGNLFKKAIE